jgi:hypothetical protein
MVMTANMKNLEIRGHGTYNRRRRSMIDGALQLLHNKLKSFYENRVNSILNNKYMIEVLVKHFNNNYEKTEQWVKNFSMLVSLLKESGFERSLVRLICIKGLIDRTSLETIKTSILGNPILGSVVSEFNKIIENDLEFRLMRLAASGITYLPHWNIASKAEQELVALWFYNKYPIVLELVFNNDLHYFKEGSKFIQKFNPDSFFTDKIEENRRLIKELENIQDFEGDMKDLDNKIQLLLKKKKSFVWVVNKFAKLTDKDLEKINFDVIDYVIVKPGTDKQLIEKLSDRTKVICQPKKKRRKNCKTVKTNIPYEMVMRNGEVIKFHSRIQVQQ